MRPLWPNFRGEELRIRGYVEASELWRQVGRPPSMSCSTAGAAMIAELNWLSRSTTLSPTPARLYSGAIVSWLTPGPSATAHNG